jgi:hypothetical protein
MPVESESQEIISSGSDVLQPAEQIPADMAMGEKSPVSVPRVSKRIEVEQHNTQEERYPQKAIEDGAVTKKVSKDIDVQFYTTESMQDNHAEMENDLSVIDKTSERVYIDSE